MGRDGCAAGRTNATHVESDWRPAGRRHVHAFNFKNFQPSFNQRRHIFICENACASSLTSTLHRLLIENRYILFARPRDPSCVRHTFAASFEERWTSQRNLSRVTGPARLLRHLSTCAASVNLFARRNVVKRIVRDREKKFAITIDTHWSVPLNGTKNYERRTKNEKQELTRSSSFIVPRR